MYNIKQNSNNKALALKKKKSHNTYYMAVNINVAKQVSLLLHNIHINKIQRDKIQSTI